MRAAALPPQPATWPRPATRARGSCRRARAAPRRQEPRRLLGLRPTRSARSAAQFFALGAIAGGAAASLMPSALAHTRPPRCRLSACPASAFVPPLPPHPPPPRFRPPLVVPESQIIHVRASPIMIFGLAGAPPPTRAVPRAVTARRAQLDGRAASRQLPDATRGHLEAVSPKNVSSPVLVVMRKMVVVIGLAAHGVDTLELHHTHGCRRSCGGQLSASTHAMR